MSGFTIGRVARQAGVGVETIRFYERKGLIEAPPRRTSGYRQFSDDTVKRLRFIKRAQELGFSLSEIADLLSFRAVPSSSCKGVKQRAEGKLADIERKLRDLQRMKKTLMKLVEDCRGSGPIGDCPILDALEPTEK
jgi:Hg(II)-responsive transcriptional regulator